MTSIIGTSPGDVSSFSTQPTSTAPQDEWIRQRLEELSRENARLSQELLLRDQRDRAPEPSGGLFAESPPRPLGTMTALAGEPPPRPGVDLLGPFGGSAPGVSADAATTVGPRAPFSSQQIAENWANRVIGDFGVVPSEAQRIRGDAQAAAAAGTTREYFETLRTDFAARYPSAPRLATSFAPSGEDLFTANERVALGRLASELADVAHVRTAWPAADAQGRSRPSLSAQEEQTMRQQVFAAAAPLAASPGFAVAAFVQQQQDRAYPAGFREVYGGRPPAGAADDLITWQQNLAYFRQASDVPPITGPASLADVNRATSAWDMGRAVFVEGRYGWAAVFPGSPLSRPGSPYEVDVWTLLNSSHNIIAGHQANMLQQGLQPSQRHPWVPPQLWGDPPVSLHQG